MIPTVRPTSYPPAPVNNNSATATAMRGANEAAKFDRQLNATQKAATDVMKSVAKVCGPSHPVISKPESKTGHYVCFPGDSNYSKSNNSK